MHIFQTSKYKPPVLLNSINMQSDELTFIIRNVDNISLSEFKKTSKSYMLNTYTYECIIPNCYVCRTLQLHASHYRVLLILL